VTEIHKLDLRPPRRLWLNHIGFGIPIADRFKRRVSGCKHDQGAFFASAHPSHVSSMIPGLLRFLESRIFFSLDPNQTEEWERGEDGRPGAQHNGRRSFLGAPP
jgi:hypothetical protein